MTFVEILNKALNDQDFASLIIDDPAAALSSVGVDPTQERVDALRLAVDAMIAANQVMGDREVVANV